MLNLIPKHSRGERLSITCPLGLRFFDSATNSFVGDGLTVEAFSRGNPERRVAAVANRSAVYAFHGLPVLRDFEYSTDEGAEWRTRNSERTYIVEGVDEFGRFLPFRLNVSAPAMVFDASASPPAGLQIVPLFSAPARLVPAGSAIVRTEFYELETGQPASWTVARLRGNAPALSLEVIGMADSEGRMAMTFPYPESLASGLVSPPATTRKLSDQTWPLKLEAWHYAAGESDFADLDLLLPLLGEAPGELWEMDSPPAPFAGADLSYGRELILPSLRSEGSGNLQPRRLYITWAGSPPSTS